MSSNTVHYPVNFFTPLDDEEKETDEQFEGRIKEKDLKTLLQIFEQNYTLSDKEYLIKEILSEYLINLELNKIISFIANETNDTHEIKKYIRSQIIENNWSRY